MLPSILFGDVATYNACSLLTFHFKDARQIENGRGLLDTLIILPFLPTISLIFYAIFETDNHVAPTYRFPPMV
jgi:hypothetical protein